MTFELIAIWTFIGFGVCLAFGYVILMCALIAEVARQCEEL